MTKIVGAIITFLVVFYILKNYIDKYFVIPVTQDQILGVIVCVLSSFLFYYTIKEVLFYLKTKNWKLTKATVLKSDVIGESDGEFTMYEPVISYKYVISGEKYISDKIYPIGPFRISIKYFSKKIINRYKINSKAEVYYNPLDPSESFLERKGLTLLFLVLIVSLCLEAFSIMLILRILDNRFGLIIWR